MNIPNVSEDTMSTTRVILSPETIGKHRAEVYALLREKLKEDLQTLTTRIEALDAYMQVTEGRLMAGAMEGARNTEAIVVDACSEVVDALTRTMHRTREVVENVRRAHPRKLTEAGVIKVAPKGWDSK
jgi:hypothetical protein